MQKKKERVDIVPFHGIFYTSFSAGYLQIPLSPSEVTLSPTRLPVTADAFAHFRVKNFRARLLASNRTGLQTVAFIGGVQDTLPTTFQQTGELLYSKPLGTADTRPSEWINPSRLELSGPFTWYKTVPGGADPTEEQPGYLILTSSVATDSVAYEVEGVFEFKVPASTANTPKALAALASLREERRRVAREQERKLLQLVLSSK